MLANLAIYTARCRRWSGQEYHQEVYFIDTLPIGTLPNALVTRLTLWDNPRKFLSRLKSRLISSKISSIFILTASPTSLDGGKNGDIDSSRDAKILLRAAKRPANPQKANCIRAAKHDGLDYQRGVVKSLETTFLPRSFTSPR